MISKVILTTVPAQEGWNSINKKYSPKQKPLVDSRDNEVYPVHVRVLPWYENCVQPWDSWGWKNPYIPTWYRAYIGISHRGTLVGVHPTIPWLILHCCRKKQHSWCTKCTTWILCLKWLSTVDDKFYAKSSPKRLGHILSFWESSTYSLEVQRLFLNGFSVKTIVLVGIYNQQFKGTILFMVLDFEGYHTSGQILATSHDLGPHIRSEVSGNPLISGTSI